MTPREIITDAKPLRCEHGIEAAWRLAGSYYTHLPEVGEGHDLHSILSDIKPENLKLLHWHELAYIRHDERRYHSLALWWWGAVPLMFTTNAGREGDDHAERFVLSPIALNALAGKLRPPPPAPKAIKLDVPLPQLTYFYGRELTLNLD